MRPAHIRDGASPCPLEGHRHRPLQGANTCTDLRGLARGRSGNAPAQVASAGVAPVSQLPAPGRTATYGPGEPRAHESIALQAFPARHSYQPRPHRQAGRPLSALDAVDHSFIPRRDHDRGPASPVDHPTLQILPSRQLAGLFSPLRQANALLGNASSSATSYKTRSLPAHLLAPTPAGARGWAARPTEGRRPP